LPRLPVLEILRARAVSHAKMFGDFSTKRRAFGPVFLRVRDRCKEVVGEASDGQRARALWNHRMILAGCHSSVWCLTRCLTIVQRSWCDRRPHT